jgi:hypothetical protein
MLITVINIVEAFVDIDTGNLAISGVVSLIAHAHVATNSIAARGWLQIASIVPWDAFIHIQASLAITRKPTVTGAGVRSNGIFATAVGTACIGIKTLVNIGAWETAADVSRITSTAIWTDSVCACGIIVTVIFIWLALVNITADESSTRISRETCARIGTCTIGTRGVEIAKMGASQTLVDINTINPISFESRDTTALEGAESILAFAIGVMAVVISISALVHINTGGTVARVTSVAFASIWACGIRTGSIFIALFISWGALIHIFAHNTVPRVSDIATTSEWTICICTFCLRVAVLGGPRTFIHILTWDTLDHRVRLVSKAATATEWSHRVCTSGFWMAIVCRRQSAFVDISTLYTRSNKTELARAFKRADCVWTRSNTVTVMESWRARTFVDIETLGARARVAYDTTAKVWSRGIRASSIGITIVSCLTFIDIFTN